MSHSLYLKKGYYKLYYFSRVECLDVSFQPVFFDKLEVNHVIDEAQKHVQRDINQLTLAQTDLICDSFNYHFDEHDCRGKRCSELVRHHRSVTFQVARLSLFLENFPLQTHNLDLLCEVFEVDCCRLLLLIFNLLNSNAGELFCVINAVFDLKNSKVLVRIRLYDKITFHLDGFYYIIQRHICNCVMVSVNLGNAILFLKQFAWFELGNVQIVHTKLFVGRSFLCFEKLFYRLVAELNFQCSF